MGNNAKVDRNADDQVVTPKNEPKTEKKSSGPPQFLGSNPRRIGSKRKQRPERVRVRGEMLKRSEI